MKTYLGLIVILLLLFCLLYSIGNHIDKVNDQHERIVIDGCEYISFLTYYGYRGLTHKGNCTNSVHIYKK